MILLVACILTCLWIMMFLLIAAARQSPRSRMHRRMEVMIREAELERAEVEKMQAGAKVNLGKEQLRTLEEIPFRERVLQPIAQAVEARLSRLAPGELRGTVERLLFLSGLQEPWTTNRLLALWVLSVVLGGAVALAAIYYSTGFQLPQKIAVFLIGLAAGAALPFLLLQNTIRRRKAALRRQLPEFLDLLCVSVQAGLSFDNAVAKIVNRMKGPLIDEFNRMLRDTSLGLTRQRALGQVAKRCDLEEIYLFTSSVVQSERLGTSIGRTLKNQADNMRDRHRQSVRAAAMKAPIKMLFPMIVFIFPSIFVMVLFPAVLALMKSLSK